MPTLNRYFLSGIKLPAQPALTCSKVNNRKTRTICEICLTLTWRRPLSYRNQPTDLRSKSMGWFLYDNGLRHERVKLTLKTANGIKDVVLVSLLLTLNRFHTLYLCFHCWPWTRKCWLETYLLCYLLTCGTFHVFKCWYHVFSCSFQKTFYMKPTSSLWVLHISQGYCKDFEDLILSLNL